MFVTHKPLSDLTVNDLMTRDVITVPQEMSLREAGHLLSRAQISGAPVVDEGGRCVGVISTSDFVRRVEEEEDDRDIVVAPFREGCVCDWEVVDLEGLSADPVYRYMTHDPVLASAQAGIRELARMMLDAHIHRMVVVDAHRHPVGIVTSTDLMAALAYAEM